MTIFLNEQVFQVTHNLYAALCHLRHHDYSRLLWIDALYIDQSDILEWDHQVRNMGDIYPKCERVLIRLSEADHRREMAITFIHKVCGYFETNEAKSVEDDLDKFRETDVGLDVASRFLNSTFTK